MANSLINTSTSPDRFERLPWIFQDEGLHWLENLLDEAFRVPILGFRFGIDGIIGLIPGLGDIIVSLLTLIIPIAAWVRGASWSLLLRMVANLGLSLAIGAIPILGDAFDIYWKPNRRNYHLLVRHIHNPRRHHLGDWIFLLSLLGGLALLFLLPLAITLWAIIWFGHWLQTV
jgi:hypothetical protein